MSTDSSSKPIKLSNVKIACILDEFTARCFIHECNLISFRPDNWNEILCNNKPDFLLVESAWHGNNNSWQYKIAKYNKQDKRELIELIQWCKTQSIPTVFWNKEDPFHFERFIESAALFDYVFTTDANMIDKYIKTLGHNNIDVLQFAAQPKLHNPIRKSDVNKNTICFAGTYYKDRHEARRKDMEMLLDASIPFGLDIFDRNYRINSSSITPFNFPERFEPYICGSLEYNDVVEAYKSYKIFLNVNSIKDSPTMFSRRIFEILASGTPVVSNYAKGIEETLGSDIIFMVNDKYQYYNVLKELLVNKNLYEKIRIKGIREVLSKHTYTHRIIHIMEKLEIKVLPPVPPNINIIAAVNNENELNAVIDNYLRQSYTNKSLLIITTNNYDSSKASEINSITERKKLIPCKIIKEKDIDLYGSIKDICYGQYICFFDFDSYYSENFLTDLVNSIKYADSKIIGKSSYFMFDAEKQSIKVVNPNQEFKYNLDLEPSTCITHVKALKNTSLRNLYTDLTSGQKHKKLTNDTSNTFSVDKFNYLKGYSLIPDDKKLKNKILSQICI